MCGFFVEQMDGQVQQQPIIHNLQPGNVYPSDTQVTNILHSLKVISKTKENDRLNTKSGIFIDSFENFLQPITRWARGERRDNNLETITDIFNKAFDMAFLFLEHRKTLSNMTSNNSLEWLQNTQIINRVTAEITSAQKGLSNLKTTYKGDQHTVARIVLLYETIQDKLQQIEYRYSSLQEGGSAVATAQETKAPE